MDPVLETNAPFYGEVLTLREPLARYRMHGQSSDLEDRNGLTYQIRHHSAILRNLPTPRKY
jgi:hypothetical protein